MLPRGDCLSVQYDKFCFLKNPQWKLFTYKKYPKFYLMTHLFQEIGNMMRFQISNSKIRNVEKNCQYIHM